MAVEARESEHTAGVPIAHGLAHGEFKSHEEQSRDRQDREKGVELGAGQFPLRSNWKCGLTLSKVRETFKDPVLYFQFINCFLSCVVGVICSGPSDGVLKV